MRKDCARRLAIVVGLAAMAANQQHRRRTGWNANSATLNGSKVSSHWFREGGAADAVAELAAAVLSSDAQTLTQHAQARQAVIDLTAALAGINIPVALVLQERIRQLR